MVVDKTKTIVIVGAGCFGLSTAYHLLKRGFTNVTVLDRSPTLPAPEAASTDINKIVRSSYADPFYAHLARDAIATWKDRDEWGDTYHESGVLVLLGGRESYSDQSYTNDRELGAHVDLLDDGAAMRSVFPSAAKISSFEGQSGYLNHDGGWVHASQGMEIILEKVKQMGGKMFSGQTSVGLVYHEGRTVGVGLSDGTTWPADLVVLSVGSWTAATFGGSLELGEMCVATGQTIGKIQLSQEEAEIYRKCPVYMDLNSGFYVFPPNDQNVVKCAIHSGGYTYVQPEAHLPLSAPIFPKSSGGKDIRSQVPRTALEELREQLRQVYPELAAKTWSSARLCWYTDSPDEDWVIGFHPSDPNVMLATAGSGHAFKFLPVIGSLVADTIEGKLPPELVNKFAVDRQKNDVPLSRPGFPVRQLDLDELCFAEDVAQV